MNYHDITSLANVYLEDSFVIGIREQVGVVAFELEAVLTESHGSYLPPNLGEQYCYRRATLSFSGVRNINWSRKEMPRFFDASGEIDFGNIDSFVIDNSVSTLEGDWGAVMIECESVAFSLIASCS